MRASIPPIPPSMKILELLKDHPNGLGAREIAEMTGLRLFLVTAILERQSESVPPIVTWSRIGHGKKWRSLLVDLGKS